VSDRDVKCQGVKVCHSDKFCFTRNVPSYNNMLLRLLSLSALAYLLTVQAAPNSATPLSVQALSTQKPTPVLVLGPYSTKTVTLKNKEMDSSDHRMFVQYPTGDFPADTKFPLISFAHGLGNSAGNDYNGLFDGLVSFGYIVVAHYACVNGCADDWASLPDDPWAFAHYYKQQLLAIEWAKESARTGTEGFTNLDPTAPVGVSGHSMGGQSALFAASYGNATDHNISTAVLHHAYTHEYPGLTLPYLAFTGQEDYVALPSQTYEFYDASPEGTVKGLSDKKTAGHFECEDDFQLWPSYNPLTPQYTAAWFKVHLEEKREEFGVDFYDLIYGDSETSICAGKEDGEMKRCEMTPPAE